MQQCAHRSILDEGVAGAPAQAGVSPATTGGTNQTTTAAVTAGVPHQRIDFVYDWQGRRLAKHVYSSANGSTWTFQSGRRFLYDGWNLIAEYTAASAAPGAALTLTASHTWGIDVSGTAQGAGGVGGLLASTLHDGASSQTFLPSFDGNGNISAWSDPGGALLTRTDYSPFGQVVARYRLGPPGDTRPDRLAFGFSTKYTDAESGLLYYGYRYLDPVAGRWLSRDPIGERGGVNLYGFVFNNSLQWYDHLGGVPGKYDPSWRKPDPAKDADPTQGARKIIGTVGSIATGDIFHDPSEIPSYDGKQCKFLFTVTGINMEGDTQKDFYDRVKGLPYFKAIPNPTYVNNPTNYPIKGFGAGDLVQILLNEVLFAITVADQEMAKQMKAAARKAKENGCPCWCIYVVAHSQGTMVFRRAVQTLDSETRKHIHFTGLGGQTIIEPGMGLGSAENFAEKQDPVPNLSPGTYGKFRHVFDDPLVNGGKESHSWENVYLPFLQKNPSVLDRDGDCK